MQIQTTRLGHLETIEVPDEALLTFPEGLPGFEERRAFAFIRDAEYDPFCWLQSLDDPAIRFLLVPPEVVLPDYAVDLSDQDLDCLEPDDEAELELLAIVVVPDDVQQMTANLMAPLAINWTRRLGKQIILADERYGLRHPVLRTADQAAAEEPARC